MKKDNKPMKRLAVFLILAVVLSGCAQIWYGNEGYLFGEWLLPVSSGNDTELTLDRTSYEITGINFLGVPSDGIWSAGASTITFDGNTLDYSLVANRGIMIIEDDLGSTFMFYRLD